ncbi:hypothetical protein FSP39_012123 [Pinctada imbricata]|uniref:Acetylserotonin O-methyltransferase-like protein n=1 Tax=Pinctada imbricata TaxID=66713 RepID=A0AA89C8T2_PINIB|nr:hypothetical protein FSP39_012123 [Pinctada imbricata]
MLQPVLHQLNSQRLVLASGSPRRKQILENIGLKFDVIPSNFEENLDKSSFKHPADYARETAKRKALEVAKRLQGSDNPADLVIGADTVITQDDMLFEKPSNKEHAREMLTKFSGGSHFVCTGVILVAPKASKVYKGTQSIDDFSITEFDSRTEVFMSKLSQEVIDAYVETGESFDKAGGYGIQAVGGTLIEGIKGDYFNVMGFPLHKFCVELMKIYNRPDK